MMKPVLRVPGRRSPLFGALVYLLTACGGDPTARVLVPEVSTTQTAWMLAQKVPPTAPPLEEPSDTDAGFVHVAEAGQDASEPDATDVAPTRFVSPVSAFSVVPDLFGCRRRDGRPCFMASLSSEDPTHRTPGGAPDVLQSGSLHFDQPSSPGTYPLDDLRARFCDAEVDPDTDTPSCSNVTGTFRVDELRQPCGLAACGRLVADLTMTMPPSPDGAALWGTVHIDYREGSADVPIKTGGCNGNGGGALSEKATTPDDMCPPQEGRRYRAGSCTSVFEKG
jgi:hypothetical protein